MYSFLCSRSHLAAGSKQRTSLCCPMRKLVETTSLLTSRQNFISLKHFCIGLIENSTCLREQCWVVQEMVTSSKSRIFPKQQVSWHYPCLYHVHTLVKEEPDYFLGSGISAKDQFSVPWKLSTSPVQVGWSPLEILEYQICSIILLHAHDFSLCLGKRYLSSSLIIFPLLNFRLKKVKTTGEN